MKFNFLFLIFLLLFLGGCSNSDFSFQEDNFGLQEKTLNTTNSKNQIGIHNNSIKNTSFYVKSSNFTNKILINKISCDNNLNPNNIVSNYNYKNGEIVFFFKYVGLRKMELFFPEVKEIYNVKDMNCKLLFLKNLNTSKELNVNNSKIKLLEGNEISSKFICNNFNTSKKELIGILKINLYDLKTGLVLPSICNFSFNTEKEEKINILKDNFIQNIGNYKLINISSKEDKNIGLILNAEYRNDFQKNINLNFYKLKNKSNFLRILKKENLVQIDNLYLFQNSIFYFINGKFDIIQVNFNDFNFDIKSLSEWIYSNFKLDSNTINNLKINKINLNIDEYLSSYYKNKYNLSINSGISVERLEGDGIYLKNPSSSSIMISSIKILNNKKGNKACDVKNNFNLNSNVSFINLNNCKIKLDQLYTIIIITSKNAVYSTLKISKGTSKNYNEINNNNLTSLNCYDSDGGKNGRVWGYTFGYGDSNSIYANQIMNVTDECWIVNGINKGLKEYSCQSNRVFWQYANCSYWTGDSNSFCVDGRCIRNNTN